MGTPRHERLQDGLEALAQRGEHVFDALRIRGDRLPAHQPMFLERAQLLDQHLLRQAGDVLLQLACPLRAVSQHIQENGLPSPGEDAQRPLDRQARESFRDLHVEPLTKVCVDAGPRDE
jgi:hypothetical protein